MPRTRLINVADYALVLALPDDVHVAVPNAENKMFLLATHHSLVGAEKGELNPCIYCHSDINKKLNFTM